MSNNHFAKTDYLDNSFLFMIRGEYSKAYDQLQIGLKKAKRRRDKISTEEYLRGLGRLFFEMKKYSKAIEFYTLAEKVSPSMPFSYLYSAEFYTVYYKRPLLALRKCDLALRKLEVVKKDRSWGRISKDHLKSWCYSLIGANYYRLKWYKKALQILEEMIAGKLYYDRSVEFARDMLNLSKSREASIKYVKAVRSWARKMKRTEMLAWIKAVWPR